MKSVTPRCDKNKQTKQNHFYQDQPCTSIFPTYWSIELRITVTSSTRAAILKLTTSELLVDFPSETKSNNHWPELNIVCEVFSSNNGMASQNKDVKACNRRFGFTISEQFQMAVERNYVVAIATLSDWLTNLALVFQPMRSKTKTNRTLYTLFFLRFKQITGNCQEF